MTNSTDMAILKMVTDVAVAHVSNNKVDAAVLPDLMKDIYQSYKIMKVDMENANRSASQPAPNEHPAVNGKAAEASVVEGKTSQGEEDKTPQEDAEEGRLDRVAYAAAWGKGQYSLPQHRQSDNSQKPAVPIQESVTPDRIVCLEDGREMTMLKRYLKTRYNMTPEQYKSKWGLPDDYPLVAPNYSRKRAKMARLKGLGKVTGKGRAKSQ